MKPVANLYSISLPQTSATLSWQRVAAFIPAIPNYVWLAMFLLAALLLASSTMLRMRSQVQVAANTHAVTQARLAMVQSQNALLKERTTQLRTNVRAAAQVAQEQLHQVHEREGRQWQSWFDELVADGRATREIGRAHV